MSGDNFCWHNSEKDTASGRQSGQDAAGQHTMYRAPAPCSPSLTTISTPLVSHARGGHILVPASHVESSDLISRITVSKQKPCLKEKAASVPHLTHSGSQWCWQDALDLKPLRDCTFIWQIYVQFVSNDCCKMSFFTTCCYMKVPHMRAATMDSTITVYSSSPHTQSLTLF